MSEKKITIEANGFGLEAVISIPAPNPTSGVIICHPHPQFGGDMHNNVVFGVKNALDEAGVASLRFNFRGVGGSQGNLAGPEGDTKDIISLIEEFRGIAEIGAGKVALAGYSYGAMIVLNACRGAASGAPTDAKRTTQIAAIVALSPPVGMFNMDYISQITCPLLVIAGDRDAFCPLDKIRNMIPADARFEILKGADHFYMGREDEAGRIAADFLKGK